MLQLLTLLWLFQTNGPARSTLTPTAPSGEFAAPADATRGFTLLFTAEAGSNPGDRVLVDIPEVLTVRLRPHAPGDRDRQNYPAFRTAEGAVPVLEATLQLHSPDHPQWTRMTVGIPLAMLPRKEGSREFVLHFSGVRWTLYVDGELLDNDFPYGYPRWPGLTRWSIDRERVLRASLHVPALTPHAVPSRPRRTEPVAYWSPPGHNTWVGDVATLYHQGRYHVFYLFDRRHHASKFGQGAHYFEHLSTADFRHWTEHEAATPLEEQWECIGTGTPFVRDGKLCLAYGLHTERIFPDDRTTFPAQMAYLKKHGRTGTFGRNAPGAPIGATYSVSADGVSQFSKTWDFFHPCRNPSIYRAPDGSLRMLANHHGQGSWIADPTDGGWRCVDPDFPPGGDCTFFFRWGRFDYILGGFTGLWSRPAGREDSRYESLVARGLDFYDGLNVPAISEIPGGRFLMAGWVGVRGWGGVLAIHELIQMPDGRVGSKWMPELTPRTASPRRLGSQPASSAEFEAPAESCLLTFEVVPGSGGSPRFGVSLLPRVGERAGCEFQVRVADRRAQYAAAASGFAEPRKSLREGGEAQSAIENLLGMDRPFTVRLAITGNAKLGGSILDAEIAGQRTMISYRPELTVGRIQFRTEGLELRNVRVAAIAEK
jgi:hypothetical protein